MASRRSNAPALIGTGMVLHSVGLALLVLAASAASGLDRSGYPVVGALGHPIWIVIASLVSVGGGVIAGCGVSRAFQTMLASRRDDVLPPST